jgi:hypothetical protein
MMDECLSLNQSTFKLITRIIATYGSGTWFILRTSKNGFTKTFLNSQLPRVTYRKVLQPFRRIAATPRPHVRSCRNAQFIRIFQFIKLPIISTRQFHLIMWTETAVHFATMSLLLPVLAACFFIYRNTFFRQHMNFYSNYVFFSICKATNFIC